MVEAVKLQQKRKLERWMR